MIAEAGGYKLDSYVGSSGGLNFLLGGGIGMGFENVAELGKAPLHVLGPGARRHADAEGHVALFGIAAKEVTAVELTYASGPPLRVEGIEGGFVLLAEPGREPQEVLLSTRKAKSLAGSRSSKTNGSATLSPDPPKRLRLRATRVSGCG